MKRALRSSKTLKNTVSDILVTLFTCFLVVGAQPLDSRSSNQQPNFVHVIIEIFSLKIFRQVLWFKFKCSNFVQVQFLFKCTSSIKARYVITHLTHLLCSSHFHTRARDLPRSRGFKTLFRACNWLHAMIYTTCIISKRRFPSTYLQ